ncbi:LysM peptidoglycan-binding domain-containing protein [Kineosporia succinea]|uniref:LysM domain-containing protein n=1 Tax=Kineosporia succinea TaxID=84632 RepID=A0ABT9NW03_9ACTN|nr:LysM peptidoglycan-binding domain-containing protein [Kineosporia succinea]MDP9824606.1 hypothetical protein [Kineosporia succinea]
MSASPSARSRVAPRMRSGRSDRRPVHPLLAGSPHPRPRPRLRVVGENERALSGPPPLRLTRRGRLVVRGGVLLLGVVAVVAGVLLLTRPAEAGSAVGHVPVSYHRVLPGETLWEIAGDVAPGTDRRDTVAEIIELNALPGAAVGAGQRIALPGS